MTLFHQNIASLCKKLDSLELLISDFNENNREIDILCFSETFVKEGFEGNIKLSNYKLVSSFCRQDKNRGGTCILIRKLWEAKPLTIPSGIVTKIHFECCGIEIMGMNLIVCVIYRVPDYKISSIGMFLHKLEKLLHYLTSKYQRKKIIICGDWNLDILKPNKHTEALQSILKSFNFQTHIDQPTRGNSCLDQIASNIKEIHAEILNVGLSDHETAQTVTLKGNKQKCCNSWFEYKRDYNVDNMKKFYDCITSLTFSEVFESDKFEEAFKSFYDLFCMFYDLCFPVIKVKINNRPRKLKWITKGLRISSKYKRQLYLTYRLLKTNKPTNKLNFHKYSKVLRKCIHTAQKIHNHKTILNSKNKGRATWNAISSTVSDRMHSDEINMITINNSTHSDPQVICNSFNDYFINDTTKQTPKLNNTHKKIENNSRTIFLKPTDENEINNIIMSFKNSKSHGHDGIISKILKLCAFHISRALAHIINLSFEEGVFPDDLKLSIVHPLHKKGDKQDMGNYRPITLVSVLSKVFEKAMLKRLNDFISSCDILQPEQFGFRKGSSTSLACFEFVKYVTECINNNTPVLSLFLDMSCAFDYVNHDKLLHKLESYGIRGNAYAWLESYLRSRRQGTEIKKLTQKNNIFTKETHRSQLLFKKTGVPQGSILGPLLFLLYVNELPNATSHKCILFADDTTIIVKSDGNTSLDSVANTALTNIIEWLEAHDLRINLQKTKIMQFRTYRSSKQHYNILYDNNKIDEVESYKFLGVNIDTHLNWKEHIDIVCRKLQRFTFALKNVRQNISIEAALTAYHGYVSSVLSYGILLWGNSVEVERALLVQKRCIRALSNIWYLDSCKPYFKKYNILPLPCLYIREACMFVKSFPYYFKTRQNTTSRRLRNKYADLIYQPPCHKDIYKKNVYNMCILIYNTLPKHLKDKEGGSFKNNLTKWLIENCFYSIKEYLEWEN
ncbi:hypothetical protein ABMA27_008153 [Loxostege sticticalis]|uniref:Reverse transcriptase domain-containing protein n=1 Tax=Loxostege sticticalis TaxID=481309 RepID=A0ABR3HE63_LOXSC